MGTGSTILNWTATTELYMNLLTNAIQEMILTQMIIVRALQHLKRRLLARTLDSDASEMLAVSL